MTGGQNMPTGHPIQANAPVPYTTDPKVPGGHVQVSFAMGGERVGPGHGVLRPLLQMKFAGQSPQTVSFFPLHCFVT